MITSILAGSLVLLASLPGEGAYLKGYDAFRAGEYARAQTQFQACGTDPALAPWAAVRIGMCLARQNDIAGAEAAFKGVIDGAEGPWQAMARGHLATLSAKRKDHGTVLSQLSDFQAIAPTPWWMESYLWTLSESALATSETGSRLSFLRGTVENTNYIKQRLDASRMLIRSSARDDQALALLGLLRASAYTDLQQAVATSPVTVDGPGGPISVAQLAGTLHDADPGNDGPVLSLIRARSGDPAALFTAAYATRILTQKKNYVGAEFLCNFLAEIAPASRDAGETAWYLGGVLEKAGKLDDALRVFDILPTRCPTHFRADDALYQIGQIHLRRGEVAKGVESLVRLGREFPESRFRSQAYYMSATHPATATDPDRARLYLSAAAENGLGFYHAHRALARLKEKGEAVPAQAVNLKVDGKNPVLLPFDSMQQEPAALGPDILGDPAFQRLDFFARHGMEESEWEVVPLLVDIDRHPDQEARYRAIAESGVAHTALQFAMHNNWGVGEKGERSLARLRLEYPRAYWDEVQAMAKETGLDPYLILSVARQESTFRPNLTSRSGASGVMQLMPATAKWLAEVDPNIEPVHVKNLESPVNSLRLGAWYLHRMLARSKGNLVDTVASYNGGPGNRDKWRAQFRNAELDAFVESIPFDETRDYVYKVLGNYVAYHSLYPPAS